MARLCGLSTYNGYRNLHNLPTSLYRQVRSTEDAAGSSAALALRRILILSSLNGSLISPRHTAYAKWS